jgi:hypothetical protein
VDADVGGQEGAYSWVNGDDHVGYLQVVEDERGRGIEDVEGGCDYEAAGSFLAGLQTCGWMWIACRRWFRCWVD